jgi:hypothetical protein
LKKREEMAFSGMPKELEIDKETIKVVAIQVGFREAARQFGISQNTILSWARREGWADQVRKAQQAKELLIEKQGLQSVALKSASDVMVNMKEDSKLYLAATLCKTAQALYDQEEKDLRKNTGALRNAAATWKDLNPEEAAKGANTAFQVNTQVVVVHE